MDEPILARTGQRDSEERETRDCRSCYGGGVVTDDVETSFCQFEAVQSTCPICHGTGEVSVWLYAFARSSR